jgi:hypothetical protein
MPSRDNDSAGLDPRELPKPDADVNGRLVTAPCPRCREPVLEDLALCPYCGYQRARLAKPAVQPWWFVAAAILALALAVFWVLWG